MEPASAQSPPPVYGATTREACWRRRGPTVRWSPSMALPGARAHGGGPDNTPRPLPSERPSCGCVGEAQSRSMTTTATHRSGRWASRGRALGGDVAERAVAGRGRSAGSGRLATSPLPPADRIGGGVDVDGARAQWLFAMQSGREEIRETNRILAVGHADPPFCTQPPWRCAAPSVDLWSGRCRQTSPAAVRFTSPDRI